MYSGTTLTTLSGRILGGHQKIDRLARRALGGLLADNKAFPGARAILHFEGANGPDGIKRKSPARDEPWHYFFPFKDDDTQLIEIISGHYDALVQALKRQDQVRMSFEAAWLAHSVVDGLTPAHHFPYEEKLVELRGGKGIETRTSIRKKMVMPGDTRREQVKNNWKMWGPKGLLMSHFLFEFGTSLLMAPMSAKRMALKPKAIKELYDYGVIGLFKRRAKEVAALGMYEAYHRTGWTPNLARQVRQTLAPLIVQTVTLVWYAALIDARLVEKKR